MSIVRWNLKEAGCGEPTNLRANLRSDGKKSYIRLYMRVSLPHKMKPDSYTESCAVNAADGWRERNVWYPGRSVRVDQHIIIWHFRRIKLCRNNAGIFHPRTPGILVITVIEKIITVITRLKMGYFNFPDSANYGIK